MVSSAPLTGPRSASKAAPQARTLGANRAESSVSRARICSKTASSASRQRSQTVSVSAVSSFACAVLLRAEEPEAVFFCTVSSRPATCSSSNESAAFVTAFVTAAVELASARCVLAAAAAAAFVF